MPPSPTTASTDQGPYATHMLDTEEWSRPLVEARDSAALRQKFWRRAGLVPSIVPYVTPHPWLYHPFLFLSAPTLEAIDTELLSAICFVVARDNACRFCYGAFWSFLRMAGYTEADIDRLEGTMYLGDRGTAEEAALRFSVRVSQGRLTAADGASVARLREEGLGRTAVQEVAGTAALGTFVNRASTMLSAPMNKRLEDVTSSWYFDLVQPVVGPLLSGWKQLAPSVPPLSPDRADGPLAPWTAPLVGTSIGYLFQDLTNQWLHHDFALPLRTKLLILGVVARGLHDPELEEAARTLLAERVGLARDAAERAVDHLGGDAVDEREARLLRLARASIRYEADHIQRAARRHTDGCSRDEILDAVATIALCNALARLRVLRQLDESHADH